MLQKIKSLFQSVKSTVSYWFNAAMRDPDVNSRLVFLLNGCVSAVAVLALTAAFILCTYLGKKADQYQYMVLAVGGGAAGHALGRFLTKKGNPAPAPTKGDQ